LVLVLLAAATALLQGRNLETRSRSQEAVEMNRVHVLALCMCDAVRVPRWLLILALPSLTGAAQIVETSC
jgi:hypothetical protein